MRAVLLSFKMILRAGLNLRPGDTRSRLCFESLFSTTFRIPERDRYSRAKALKYLFKSVIKTPVRKLPEGFEKNLIFDSNDDSKLLRENYVKYFTNDSVVSFTDFNNLILYSSLSRKIFTCIGFFLFCPFIVLSVIMMDRSKLAGCSLVIEEYMVLDNLLSVTKRSGIKIFYQFSIYETYSNLFADALMKESIHVIKISSEVPLALWNKKIVSNELVICNAYQYEEIKEYKATMLFDKTRFWGPELILEIKDQYKNPDNSGKESKEFEIGFYSTGGWLRKVLGYIDQGNQMEERENKLKLALRDYVKKNKLKLGIFLHPREKRKENIERTKEHYAEFFGGADYSFLPFDIPTNKLFDKVDLAVAFTSTIMFERLYCGFKSLFVPFGMADFPIKGSSIENICAADPIELENKLSLFSSMANEEFFVKNNIENYPGLKGLS